MLKQQIIEQLRSLKLSHMARYFDSHYARMIKQQMNPMQIMDELLTCEITARRNNTIKKLIKAAKFCYPNASIESMHHGHAGKTAQIDYLFDDYWIDECAAVAILGATGTGKTWLACALGNQACRNFKKVLFVSVYELFEDISLSQMDGTLLKTQQKYAKAQVLIIDDFGVGGIPANVCTALLNIIEKQSFVGGLIITSQYPVETWHGLFQDKTLADAILDRIVHRAHRVQLQGESLRKRHATRKHTK